jgi:hypothetical protein
MPLTIVPRLNAQNAFTEAITCSTWASVSSGKIGRLTQVAAAFSATGNEPDALAQARVTLLQVQRHRIDEIGPDLVFREMFAQGISPRMANRELVKDRPSVGRLLRQTHVRERDSGQVARRNRLPARCPGGEVRQFHVEQGALKSIHAKITPDDVVVVAPVRAVHADVPRLRVDRLVLRDTNAPPSPQPPKFFVG